ncbi:MAG: hypothetical protein AAB613_01215 [Patescibacteria group bacterium]
MSETKLRWRELFSRREYLVLFVIIAISLTSVGLTIRNNYISPTDEGSTPTTIIKLSTSDHYHDNSTVKVLPNNITPDTTAAHYTDAYSSIGPTPITKAGNNLNLGRMQFEVEYRLKP